MTAYWIYPPASVFLGNMSPEPVSPSTAWLWLSAVLVICCIALWFLASPVGRRLSHESGPPPRPRRRSSDVLAPPWRSEPTLSHRLHRPSGLLRGRS